MRRAVPLAVATLLLIAAGDLSAQTRTSAIAVSATVVRSSANTDEAADAAATPDGAAARRAGTAAEPRPAVPRQTEAAVVFITPSSTETSTSVRILTINY